MGQFKSKLNALIFCQTYYNSYFLNIRQYSTKVMMLHQLTLFGALCLAICSPMVNANCDEEERTCQKVVLGLCGQNVRDACVKVGTLSCKDEICKGCGIVACQQVKICRTEAEYCVQYGSPYDWDWT